MSRNDSRGFVQCPPTGCGARWDWPGDFDTETEARAWAQTHATVCEPPQVVPTR